MLRITGMDLKMEQYRKGELFVAGIERLGGAAALRRLWDGPRDAADVRRRSTTRPRGCGGWASTSSDRAHDGGVDARARSRRGARGRAEGHRAHADPVRPLSRRGPRVHPRGGARRADRHDRLRRSPGRRPGRRRGHAPRPAARGDVRPHPRPSPRPALGPLGDGRRRARADPRQPRPGPRHHERPRRVLAPHRRVRPADDARRVAAACRSSSSSRPSGRGSRSSRASCAT